MTADVRRAVRESAADWVARVDGHAERRETPCNGGAMVWRIWGDGPPLVLLHGGHGSWTHWIRSIHDLARRFTLYVGDIPGYGDSAVPGEPYTGEGIARIVADGLDQLIPPPARYDIAGFSFGGIIGGVAASFQGERVRTMVIIGSSGLGLPPVGITDLRKWRPDMPPAELTEIHRHNLATIMFSNPDRIDEDAIYLQTQNTLRARIKGASIARSDVLFRALPRIKARMVCLSGAEDVYVKRNLEDRKRIFRAVQPDTPFDLIPDAGHWVMYEATDEFNRRLLAHLEAEGGR